jgi:ribosomal protein S4E
MKKAAIVLSVIVLTAFLSSCYFPGSIKGNGNVVEETRELGEFSKISVSRGMNVYISQGTSSKVVVKADENLLKVIDTYVDHGTLKVTALKGIRNATSNKVYVTVTDLENIKSTSGSNIFSEDSLKLGNLEIKSTAGSNIRLSLESGELSVSASAGSNIFLNGTAKSVNIKASSGSNIKAGDLQSENCDAKVSSGANIWIKVQNGLTAKASSGGNLFYSGEPNPLRVTKSSGGNIIKN